MSVVAADALGHVLSRPTFELIPLKGAMELAALLPRGARVAVTASPTKGIEATVELAGRLQGSGFHAVPHLSARMVDDRAHLVDLLGRLKRAGVDGAFVVGGDGPGCGRYPDGLSLLREMEDIGDPMREIGIPCYPEGHPSIPQDVLLAALAAKAEYASYMTTQLCFDASRIAQWIAARRAEGMSLPVHIGVPGVTEPHRLLTMSARIGVADAHRFIAKNFRLVARLLRSGGFFKPDRLLESLAPHIAEPRNSIVGLHLYTFNAVGPTESWRQRYLRGLEPAGLSHALSRGAP